MKIKVASLRREKRVYYYDHSNGVLKQRTQGYKAFMSTMVAVFVIGGTGFGALKAVDYQQQHQEKKASMARQSVASANVSQQESKEDKLKNANKKAQEDEELAKRVKSKLKNVPGGQKWSVYIRDINSDKMASINADNDMEMGSLSNLFLTLPLENKTPSEKWNYKTGKSTISQCVQSMINSSDQNCAKSLSSYVDLKNADNVLHGAGFKKTSLTDKKPETTARDMGELMYRLQTSQLLSDKARRVVFDGLYSQKQREGISRGCDQSCLVASISSESQSHRHDAAIVTSGKAKYVVVIMTNNGSWSQIADVSQYIRAELVELVP